MNLANKLTLTRVFLVPVFLIFMYLKCPFNYFIALAVFTAAAITDALDGHIARSRNLVTNFGKFLDPLADKVLVIAALAVFVEMDNVKVGAVPFIIIVTREFMVSGLRLVAANSGLVVAAGLWGKLKTVFTMITVIGILVWLSFTANFNCFGFKLPAVVFDAADITVVTLVWISTVLTVVSGIVYLKGYWKVIDTNK